MKVFVKRPNEIGEVVEVPKADDCREYKKLIGCNIVGGVTMPSPMSNIYLCCDDDGKLMGLQPNFYLPEYRDLVVGTAVFVGIGEVQTTMPDGEVIIEHDFCSLESWQIPFLRFYCKLHGVNS